MNLTTSSRKIFITINEGFIARNILRSFVLEKLLFHEDVKVYLLVPQDKASWYEAEFGSARTQVISISAKTETFFNRALKYLARNGFYTETILTDQETYSRSRISFLIKRAIVLIFGRSIIFHAWIRWLAGFRAPTKEMRDVFEKYRPALLFATDIMSDFDLDALAAARKNKVKVVGMIRSWDNPTSGGLIQIVPEIILVWNPYLYEKLSLLQHIPEERIKIVGITYYDWYVRKDIMLSREKFLEKFGIKAAQKIILFAGIGEFLAPHEAEVAEIISEAIAEGRIQKSPLVIFRPHPAFKVNRERIAGLKHFVFDDNVAIYTASAKSSADMDIEKTAHLVNSIAHADLVITTASTMTIDAAAFNKPVICIGFDGKSSEAYRNSVKRYYQSYTHYIEISKTHGFKIAYSAEDLIEYINQYLEDPREDENGRKLLFQKFIWKMDGKSSQRLVRVLLKELAENL